jgi:hypothetical protein
MCSTLPRGKRSSIGRLSTRSRRLPAAYRRRPTAQADSPILSHRYTSTLRQRRGFARTDTRKSVSAVAPCRWVRRRYCTSRRDFEGLIRAYEAFGRSWRKTQLTSTSPAQWCSCWTPVGATKLWRCPCLKPARPKVLSRLNSAPRDASSSALHGALGSGAVDVPALVGASVQCRKPSAGLAPHRLGVQLRALVSSTA